MALRSIILIGPRGSGKTTVGRLLAERLGLPFLDADAELEQHSGRTIREIFEADGEEFFRDLESTVLADLLGRGPIVLATGGGVVLRPANRKRLRESGCVFWLTGSPESLWRRLQADPETASRRPNLTRGGMEEIAEVLQAREALYRECADLSIPTDNRSPEEIANDILLACKTFSS